MEPFLTALTQAFSAGLQLVYLMDELLLPVLADVLPVDVDDGEPHEEALVPGGHPLILRQVLEGSETAEGSGTRITRVIKQVCPNSNLTLATIQRTV